MKSMRALATSSATALIAAGISVGFAPGATAAPATPTTYVGSQVVQTAAPDRGWQARDEDYPHTTTRRDLPIEMSDGTVLRGDLMLPAHADGTPVDTPLPVVVTITAYNKSLTGGGSISLGGADPRYLVKRGYAQLTVDARGTGNSDGQWGAFSARENKDAGEVMQWAHEQEWSNGKTAMSGPSYMGISQIWAASAQPDGLKAIFPQVPAADVYRDVVASGGQIDVGFMPLWMGLVTVTGIVPPAVTLTDPLTGLGVLVEHLFGATSFTAPMLLEALLAGVPAHDGDFYAERSPINVIDQVEVPTFLLGGQFDLFQRGTPLLFENLQKRGVPVKMIFGPWDHLQGSGGMGVEEAGHGSLAELQLRWFDHYVLGLPDPALDTDIPPLTWFEQGSDTWRAGTEWIGKRHSAVTYRLSGDASVGKPGALAPADQEAETGTAYVPPIPVAGLCSRSMNQWTAGIPNQAMIFNPCLEDNRLNDMAGVVFETEPFADGLSFQGPINARVHVSSLSGDGMVSVAVEDVAPNGHVTRLTGGWQVISFRELDEKRTRRLDGEIIQPHHPFTRESKQKLGPREIAPVDVEVFPTGARIQPGHRLRLAVQAFDVPHLLPTLPDLLGTLTGFTIHNSPEHPSVLTLPGIDVPGATPTAGKATSTTTAQLKKRRTKVGKRNVVTVEVRSERAAAGKVRVKVGRVKRTVRLRGGQAKVRLPARKAPGRHKVVVRYLGSAKVARSKDTTVWRVRRR